MAKPEYDRLSPHLNPVTRSWKPLPRHFILHTSIVAKKEKEDIDE